MKDKEENIKATIVLYLNGKLDQDSINNLEELIRTDKEVEKLWEEEKLIYNYVELAVRKNIYEGIVSRGFTSNSTFGIIKKKLLFILIGIVSIVCCVYFLSHYNSEATHIAKQHYAVNFSGQKSRDITSDGFDEVMRVLNERQSSNYDIVEDALLSVKKDSENFLEANYLLGHLYFQQSNFKKASESFTIVVENGSELNDQSRWYQALSLLADNKTDIAEEILISLSKDSLYSSKAKEILKKIK